MKKSLSLKRLDSLVGNQKECWEWQWSRAGRGLLYGSALWNGKQTTAHRVAYQYWVGNIPKDMTIGEALSVAFRKSGNDYVAASKWLYLSSDTDLQKALDEVEK